MRYVPSACVNQETNKDPENMHKQYFWDNKIKEWKNYISNSSNNLNSFRESIHSDSYNDLLDFIKNRCTIRISFSS